MVQTARQDNVFIFVYTPVFTSAVGCAKAHGLLHSPPYFHFPCCKASTGTLPGGAQAACPRGWPCGCVDWPPRLRAHSLTTTTLSARLPLLRIFTVTATTTAALTTNTTASPMATTPAAVNPCLLAYKSCKFWNSKRFVDHSLKDNPLHLPPIETILVLHTQLDGRFCLSIGLGKS